MNRKDKRIKVLVRAWKDMRLCVVVAWHNNIKSCFCSKIFFIHFFIFSRHHHTCTYMRDIATHNLPCETTQRDTYFSTCHRFRSCFTSSYHFNMNELYVRHIFFLIIYFAWKIMYGDVCAYEIYDSITCIPTFLT